MTVLTKLRRDIEDAYGTDESLFNETVGIRLRHPDTQEEHKTVLTRENYSAINKMLATGWVLDILWNNQGIYTPDEMVLSLALRDALLILTKEDVFNILYPLKPSVLVEAQHPHGVWLARFQNGLSPMDGFILEQTEGIHILKKVENEDGSVNMDFIIVSDGGIISGDGKPQTTNS
jgi:hypothetical protein